jgi:predicted homoserine dehydrogenase-like protein
VAVAKRDLKAGEILDGKGGYTVVGRLMPAETSLKENCLRGLAHGWKVLEPVAAGQPLRWSTVAVDTTSSAVRLRREMELAASRELEAASPHFIWTRFQTSAYSSSGRFRLGEAPGAASKTVGDIRI